MNNQQYIWFNTIILGVIFFLIQLAQIDFEKRVEFYALFSILTIVETFLYVVVDDFLIRRELKKQKSKGDLS